MIHHGDGKKFVKRSTVRRVAVAAKPRRQESVTLREMVDSRPYRSGGGLHTNGTRRGWAGISEWVQAEQ